jgi:TolB-like protein/tetratricopeptide (TPR) repeat protein/tRNA A-37 threonylcarbamoyl transferase component Bud32
LNSRTVPVIADAPIRLREAMAGRYPIERPLGRGGMATVYLARDVKHQRQVAVKVLHPELAAGLGTERFLREIRIEAGLQHPHILPLHDSGEVDGFLYYVMPYVEGESLRDRLTREGRLSVEETLHLGGDVAHALHYAHERGVVHRDIKPENILLSGGHALVADFGIAKAVEAAGDERLTETGWGMGTPAYMSPEQIVGDAVDGRSDVYGLACVVYEMLAGHPPFPAATARAAFARHHLEPPASIRQERPDVPEHLDAALLKALAKQPGDRFSTTAELFDRLRSRGEMESPGGSAPALVRKPFYHFYSITRLQHPVWLLLVVLVAVAAAGYLIPAMIPGLRGTQRFAGSVAVLPIQDPKSDSTNEYVAEGLSDELIADLARTGRLQVINRRTMQLYGKSGKSPQLIARELGVDAFVTGTLQRSGDSVALSAQATETRTGQPLWARSYRGSRADLMGFGRDIAGAVSAALSGSSPSGAAAAPEAGNPAATDAYIRGRYWWNKRGQPNLLRAIQFFGQALDADPTFAPAYSATADAYVQLGYGSYLAPEDAFPKAEAAARKALELDSTLAEPHATLGFVKLYYAWDWAAADREFKVAIARNPSYATAHEWYGLYLAAMGRFDEAVAEERRAQRLDPLSVGVASTTGWVMHYSGRQADAERTLRTALRMDSGFPIAHLYLGRVLQAEGQLDGAVAQFESAGPLRLWVPTIAGLGNIYAIDGRRDHALDELRRLDSLSKTQYVTAYAVALIHTALGQRDSAFAWLDRAVEERTHWLVWLNRDLRWKPLRGDPRFPSLVRRVGLPP